MHIAVFMRTFLPCVKVSDGVWVHICVILACVHSVEHMWRPKDINRCQFLLSTLRQASCSLCVPGRLLPSSRLPSSRDFPCGHPRHWDRRCSLPSLSFHRCGGCELSSLPLHSKCFYPWVFSSAFILWLNNIPSYRYTTFYGWLFPILWMIQLWSSCLPSLISMFSNVVGVDIGVVSLESCSPKWLHPL